jgi:MFS transporter, SHS family, lactate transporter
MSSTNQTSQVPWWREPTRPQWLTFLAAWLGWVLDAFDFTIFLLVMPQIAREFGVSYVATAGSITLTLLVRMAGGLAAGWASDRFGRKLPLMISIVWFAACDGAVALAPSFAWVLALRTLFGFGMGAEWTSGATLAMENWPARSRGIASGVLQGSWAIGYLCAAAVAAVVVPAWGWRPLFAIAALPALLALPIRWLVPESPEWLRARRDPARSASTPALSVLRVPGLGRRLFWASAMLAAGFGGYYGMTGMYSPLLAHEHGLDTRGIAALVALFNIGMLAGGAVWGTLASRRGLVAAITIPALLMSVAAPLYVGMLPTLLGLGAFLGGFLGGGHSGTTPLLLATLFPPEVRARAVGFVYHAGAFAAAFVPFGIAAFAQRSGTSLAATIALVVAVCELLVVIAVAGGLRPLLAQPPLDDYMPMARNNVPSAARSGTTISRPESGGT